MAIVLSLPLVMANMCMKFNTNILNILGEKIWPKRKTSPSLKRDILLQNHVRVTVNVLPCPLMMVNMCTKFGTNSFNIVREKRP